MEKVVQFEEGRVEKQEANLEELGLPWKRNRWEILRYCCEMSAWNFVLPQFVEMELGPTSPHVAGRNTTCHKSWAAFNQNMQCSPQRKPVNHELLRLPTHQ